MHLSGENTENYCPRETKVKVVKCDEQKICLDVACQYASFLYEQFFNKNFKIKNNFFTVEKSHLNQCFSKLKPIAVEIATLSKTLSFHPRRTSRAIVTTIAAPIATIA